MKRDMDLCRSILLRIEEDGSLDFDNHDEKAVLYHLALMNDAGFVNAQFLKDAKGEIKGAFVERMTWAGHEFLDAARDETLWMKAKKHVLKPAGSWTVSVLSEWLKQEIKQKVFGASATLP